MRIKHIDVLRGIAALLVTIFHLTGSSGLSKTAASAGKYGYVGVEMFFVISGFILPYSMLKSNYKVRDFGKFMCKRVVRIYPAYIVAILLGIILPLLTGRQLIPWLDIFTQLTFANSFFHMDWVSAVFWTLSIEFQFYILIGLAFQAMSSSNAKSVMLILLVTVFSFFCNTRIMVFYWFPIFSLGLLIFNWRCLGMPKLHFWLGVAALVALIAFVHGVPEALASLFAVLFIAFVQLEVRTKANRLFFFLGTISYSLYLVHWEIGRAAVGFSRHIPVVGSSEIVRVTIGVLVSVLAGAILYHFVERRSVRLSSEIRYSKSEGEA